MKIIKIFIIASIGLWCLFGIFGCRRVTGPTVIITSTKSEPQFNTGGSVLDYGDTSNAMEKVR